MRHEFSGRRTSPARYATMTSVASSGVRGARGTEGPRRRHRASSTRLKDWGGLQARRLLLIALVFAALSGCRRDDQSPRSSTEAASGQATAAVDDLRVNSATPVGEAVDANPPSRVDAEIHREDASANPAGAKATLSPAALHREAIVIDTHNDVTLRLTDQPDFDFGRRAADGHTDLVRIREGGLDAQFLSVWVNPRQYSGEAAWERSLKMFDAIDVTLERYPDDVLLARTASEVRGAVKRGKVAFLIGVEGAHALGEPGTDDRAIERLRTWYDRGARYLTLTWMNSNALGGSSGDRGKRRGLTPLGRRAVREMNDWGMIVDVSHLSDPTFFDAVKASRSPVLASHSGVRAVNDHYRNITDEMLRALAENGGAACIVYYPGYLDAQWAAARRRARRRGTPMEAEPVRLEKVLEHIDHAVEVAGVDHVCLGSDFDGIGATPLGLEDVSKLPSITKALRARGYTSEEVIKILGANVLRVLEQNEGGARATAGEAANDGGEG